MTGTPRCDHGEIEQVLMLVESDSVTGVCALSTILGIAEPAGGVAIGTEGNK